MSKILISPLSPENENAYTDFLREEESSLFFHSLKYRNFLRKILKESRDHYLIAAQNNKVVGALPTFINNSLKESSIINSLPFFGSHGGLLLSQKIESPLKVGEKLIREALSWAHQENCLSLNIIDHPLYPQKEILESLFGLEPTDYRISQITPLSGINLAQGEETLMMKFHSKTRNMVRKALKSGFSLLINNSLEGFQKIEEIHAENMSKIGGKAKPFSVFKALYETFSPGEDYDIYFAVKEGRIAAGLLLFYYKEYCEYFTPVIQEEYRNHQPLSFIIFMAMKEAIQRGFRYWNWGGTWPSLQQGVYLFKKRWGAEEKPYSYYTKIFDLILLNQNKELLLEKAPYFYIKNFRNDPER